MRKVEGSFCCRIEAHGGGPRSLPKASKFPRRTSQCALFYVNSLLSVKTF